MLPAHAGTTSLEGVSWSFSLLGHYLARGKIRKRGALSSQVRLYIVPSEPGSFTQDIIGFIADPNNLFVTSIMGQYAASTATECINSTFTYVFKEVCGLGSGEGPTEKELVLHLPSGDLDALVDAVEPSMIRSHRTINNGSSNLIINAGRDVIINLTPATKSYIEANFRNDNDVDWQGRVSAFNANTGNGRAYLVRVGKIVPFSVMREPENGTYAALSHSLDLYTQGLPSDVNLTAREVLAADGRIKKLEIRAARAT
ncbi:MAG: hypothetical protein ACRYF1_13745 [Janthinobacterium lividum]